jgi:hypothetical protein
MSSWTTRPADAPADGAPARPIDQHDPAPAPAGNRGPAPAGRPAPGPAAFRTALGLSSRRTLLAWPGTTARPAT